ncbi:MAG: short-subunit dehydrogenase [Arenicella sp.]|jgi:short-subunit dehydrogenase
MFSDKVVWITGASSGIGGALALEFAAEGARLILSARGEDSLRLVKAKCDAVSGRDNSLMLPMDITDEASLANKVELAKAWGGRIDMLINNAGITQRSSCLNTDMATYRTIFEVDVFGQIALTKAVLPGMIEQGSGHLVVTSSISGKIGVPFRTGYCAAKHAMMGFFDALRTEVDHQNIKVTTITPGYIRTPISSNALSGDGSAYGREDTEIRGGMDVSECAKVIVKGFKGRKPEISVGKGFEMNALWLKRYFPNSLLKIAARQYAKMAKNNDLS